MEKTLCRHGRWNTLEWYDKPLPAVHVTIRNICDHKLPNNPKEREELSFDPFPRSSKFVYFIEASDVAWIWLEPLIIMMIETHDITYAFGPSAFIMDLPPPTPSIEHVRAHHKHGCISMDITSQQQSSSVVKCNFSIMKLKLRWNL